jgi:hypothetical protein
MEPPQYQTLLSESPAALCAMLRQLRSQRRQTSAQSSVIASPLPTCSHASAQALQISLHVAQYDA